MPKDLGDWLKWAVFNLFSHTPFALLDYWLSDRPGSFLDDMLYAEVTTASLPINVKWVYDHPFFIIVNLAVGGVFGGDPTPSTVMPQSIAIDHVRVSTRKP